MKFLRNSYIDTVIIFLLSLGIGYFFNNQNPFLTHYEFNVYYYAMSIVALFYGFVQGAFFLILYTGGIYLISSTFPINMISHYFISLFIFSEFHYYWNLKIAQFDEINRFLRQRITELGNAYYVLKISHDEMEKTYILKPYSIRELVKEILEISKKSPQEAYKSFFVLMHKIFKIENAALYINNKKEYILGKDFEIDFNDPLIKEAMENESIYTSISKHQNSKYIAAIPVTDLRNNVHGVFVIKEIQFFNLSEENILSISFFLNYFINSLEKITKYDHLNINNDIAAELDKLIFIKQKYKIDSYILITSPEIKNRLRSSDIFYLYKDKLIILLPFITKYGIKKFIKRVGIKNYKLIEISPKKELKEIISEIENG